MFNERKIAQMAAFFLRQTPEGRMSHLKLMKLLYLAEREGVRQLGYSLSGDRWVSMPHGPVLSMTLNLMDGDVESGADGWESWISDKENHELSLRRDGVADALDELSAAECAVLDSVWRQFGGLDKWAIRDWTHAHCPEWTDPHGSSQPIRTRALADALGFTPEAARELVARIESDQAIDRFFAGL
jgi:uncharacterized phage-associated protein